MKRSSLIVALLASATAASGSVTYNFQSVSFAGTNDWQFTVPDFLSAPGLTYITSFDSSFSNTLGSLMDVQITDPFSTSPTITSDFSNGSLGSEDWTGPFDQDGVYSAGQATLTITGASSAPEPSPLALIGVGGVLLALMRRRRWISRKQIAS